jgi:hypothetical protein
MSNKNVIELSSPQLCNGGFMTLDEGPVKYSPDEGFYHEDCGDGIVLMYGIVGKKIELRNTTLKYTGCAKSILRL